MKKDKSPAKIGTSPDTSHPNHTSEHRPHSSLFSSRVVLTSLPHLDTFGCTKVDAVEEDFLRSIEASWTVRGQEKDMYAESSKISSKNAMRASLTLAQGLEEFYLSRVSMKETSLTVLDGPHKGLEVPLTQDMFYIGREEWCDLSLPNDKRVSSVHCELRVEKKGVRLIDRGSRNGSFINDVQVNDAFLTPDTTFKVGHSVCVLRTTTKKTQIDIRFSDDSGQLVGQEPAMREIFTLLPRLAKKGIPLLLTGETGTGKSSIANVLHQQSQREGECVVVNCGALSPSLIESELFGYEKGAFTGAEQRHQGYIEQAQGGTLFLDEIGELPLSLQPKLLDVLERKRLRRLGGTKEIALDFQLVTATHRDLKQQVELGEFRKDLFYRIAVMELHVPALRERKRDLPLLISHLLQQISPDQYIKVTKDALQALKEYHWPGNLRELRNVLERSLILVEEAELDADSLLMPHSHQSLPTEAPKPQTSPQDIRTMKDLLADAEAAILEDVLNALHWNVSKTAQTLEVSRSWLHGRIRFYQLKRPTD